MEKKKKPPFVLPDNLKQRFLGPQTVNRHIIACLQKEDPFLLARFGGVEGKLIGEIILKRKQDVDEGLRDQARINAGIAPPVRRIIRCCATETLATGMKADVLAVWNYDYQVQLASFCAPPKLCDLTGFDPVLLYHRFNELPWTTALFGKKVLIVHPFVQSIQKQLERRHRISIIRDIWPDDVDIQVVKPPVTFAGEHGSRTWVEELSQIKAEIASRDFDVAMIAAGAYGMPIAGLVKDMGRKAIHFGGSLQLAFGIIGARWERKSLYDGIVGEGWIRPDESEIPKLHKRVDKSSYW